MTIIKYYLISQIVILPALISYFIFRKRYNNYMQQWAVHRVILILSLIIPLLLIFKPDLNYPVVTGLSYSEGIDPISTIEPIDNTPAIMEPFTEETSHEVRSSGTGFSISVIAFGVIPGISLILLLSLALYEWIIIYRLKSGMVEREEFHGVKVVVSNRVDAPFSYGVREPSIFLPVSLGSREKEIILIHELNHIRGNHLFWLKMEVILKKLFWFNPLYYLLNTWGNELRELMCDEESVTSVNPREYGLALVNSARKRAFKRDIPCTYWGESSFLKTRVEKLLGEKSMPKGLNKLSNILSFIVVFVSVFIIPASSYALEGGDSNPNSLKAFIKASRDKGALIASQDFDLNEIIASIPVEERDQYPLNYPMKGEFGRITLPWGLVKDPFTGNDYLHTAIDIGFGFGKHIVASGGGKVIKVDYAPDGYGHFVVIEHSDGFYSLYGQMQNVAVKEGQKVEVGTYLAEMGSSGRSTGPHLHYSIFHDPRGNYFKGGKKKQDTFRRLSLNSFNFLPSEFKDSYSSNYPLWLLDEEGNAYSVDPSDITVKDDNGVLKFKRN